MFRLLLVTAVLCCAQTQSAVTSQHPRLLLALGDAAKALQAAQQSLEEALRTSPLPALTSVSTVQDWSLVCKELCGAGLGVAPCADYCAASVLERSSILGTDFGLAKCEQLHGPQSGSKCKPVESIKSYGDRLCLSFCQQRKRTLNGCSPCQLLGVWNEVSAKRGVTTHGSGPGGAGRVGPLATSKQKASRTDDGQPDWNEMCKTLCKTGDGGSLCNCDLSPFST